MSSCVPSAPYLYGADRSVHLAVPSTRKSTLLIFPPLGEAVHVTEPLSVAPFAMLEVTARGEEAGGWFATTTFTALDVLRPSGENALTCSLCFPSFRLVVSSAPYGSPSYWYGATCSVHLSAPSIRNSILVGVLLAVACQVTDPDSVVPPASAVPPTSDETVNAGLPLTEAEPAPAAVPATARTTTSRAVKTVRGFAVSSLVTPFACRVSYREAPRFSERRSLDRGRDSLERGSAPASGVDHDRVGGPQGGARRGRGGPVRNAPKPAIEEVVRVPTAARIGTPRRPARPVSGRNDYSMRSSGIEDLKTVLRRSAVLILAVVLVGVVAMNAIRQIAGPRYQASARVLLNTGGDLWSAALGISQPYQDPGRVDQAEQNLVDSPALYAYAAGRASGAVGTGRSLMDAVSGTVSNNVVDFKASTGSPAGALRSVNAVATAYPLWRAQVRGRAIDAAIAQIRARESKVGRTAELEKQLQQLQVLKTLSAGETLFVEQAPTADKTSPRPLRDSLLGGVIGLVVALLLVGGRELFDTSVRSEGDVEDALEAPVLATIESLPRRLRASVLGGNGGRFNDEYELLAANVAQIFDGHEGSAHLAITSALPGEGKTTTATNLAAALSRRGASVVLADFDLRKPAVSGFVGIPRSAAGVNELLSGSAELRSVLWHIEPNGNGSRVHDRPKAALATPAGEVVHGAEGSLMVMPGGMVRTESTSRFARLPALLDRLPADVDFVIVDTPPALLVAGMAELAQSVDGVIVVVRHGYVHRRRLRALGRQARSWRARVLGAILNDSPGQEGSLNYYSYGQA